MPIPVEEAPARRKSPWGRWLALAVVLGLGVIYWRSHSGEKVAGPGGPRGNMGAHAAVPVVVAEAGQRDFPIFLNALGTVQAYNSVTIRARVDGELTQVFFQEGQNVAKGDVLAQIDPRPYQAQLNQAVAKKAQDDAQLANAQSVQARNDQLIKKGVIDQQSYDAQKFATAQLGALVAADQAAIDNAQTQLGYTQITAPFAGRVGIRLVDAGNIVHASDTNGIVVINQVQPISVIFTLPQQQLGQIREALMKKQELKVLAVDRDNESVLSEGKLEVLDNQIDQATATVKLKAVFANTDYKLWPGQFVNVRLLVGEKAGAVVVPSAAVQRGPTGMYVYVIGSDNKAEMRTVAAGATENDQTLITEGLKTGERVVVDGQYRLQPGAEVTLEKR